MAKDRAEFHAARRKGIGGSDVGAIYGVDPYKTAMQLWLEKTGQVEPVDVETQDIQRGRKLEPLIREMYADQVGETVLTDALASPCGHPEYPWMIANVDGALGYDPMTGACTTIIEIKAPSLGAYSKIKREGLPERFILQMQHYLAVTGAQRGVWVIFCADRWEMLPLPVERDELLIEQMIDKEREFWMLVETMTPPPEVVRDVQDEPEIKVVGQVVKRRDEEFTKALANLREAKQLSDTAAQIEQEAKARIVELVADKPGYYENENIGRVSYTEVEGRKSLDKKAMYDAKLIPLTDAISAAMQVAGLYDEHPGPTADQFAEALDQYVIDISAFEKQGKPYKTFRFTPFNGESHG